MAFCQACQRETAQYGELLPGLGVISRCGHDDCRMPIDGSRLPSAKSSVPEVPRTHPQPMLTPVAASAAEDNVFSPLANAMPGTPPSAVRVPPPMPAPARRPATDAAAANVARPVDEMLVELRGRRASVKAELARLAALQREEAVLDRMIAAAEDPPN